MKPSELRVKGAEIKETGSLDESRNIFYTEAGNATLIVRQPRPWDKALVRRAVKEMSVRTKNRYATIGQLRRGVKGITDCDAPLFKVGDLGALHLIFMLDGELVGFTRKLFTKASSPGLRHHRFPDPDEIVCDCTVCIIDKWQHKGIGSMYADVSEYISAWFGADWICGVTYVKGGMLNIRMRTGWETVNVLQRGKNSQAFIRKRLGKVE